MDKIRIKDLEIFAKHGVLPEENALGQKFLVSAVLYTDTRQAGLTDELSASIDYAAVCQSINRFFTEHTYKLLECAAENLAEALLLETPGLLKLKLEIKKPWAPVGLPLDTVSVEIERGWHTAYIALGSNMGDREAYLNGGVEALDAVRGCAVEKVSSYLETLPYGFTDQDNFLNGCLKLRTLLPPRELLRELNRIEAEAGRTREIHWGPRTLDLDILLYDDWIVEEDDLYIPHVELAKRDFVLKPLCEIAPYVRHPANGRTAKEMLDALKCV
jgi:dihydroneopterin aldolase/2-amino-4-hydroxy-6-hydroxymethyldihydropteridine diphosphokinase